MEYPAPTPIPTTTNFNSSYFFDITDADFNFETASKYFLKITGGTITGSTSFLAGININGDLSCSRLNTNLTASDLSWQSIAGSTTIALNHTLNGTALLGSITNSGFGFSTNNIERARILNNGNFGIATASASYKLDVNGDINTNTILRVNRSANGQAFNSTNGSSSCVLYHFLNGDAYLGTSTVNNLVFQTFGTARMSINGSSGAVSGISQLTSTDLIATSTLTVNGVDVASNLPPALNVQGSLNPASNPSVNTGYVWYTNSSRYYGQRFIDTNNFSLLNLSAGGSYIDALVYTHSATPLFEMPMANTTFRAPIINGTTRVDTPTLNATTAVNSILVNCQTSWSSGSSRDLFTIGNSSDNYARWTASVFYASSNFNSHMTLYNQNQSQYGINIGAGQISGAAKGAMMVINGPNWDGSAITCGTSSPKGTLHINGGKSSSVPSGYGFEPSGANAVGGGTVNISLFCYWNAWIEGSLYCTSDRRLKNIIKPIDPDNAMNLLNVTAQWYNWKKDSNGQPQLGLIAQDLLRENLTSLTSLFENNDVEEDDPEFDLKSKTQLVVTYDKIPLYLLEIIKNLNNRVKDLEKKMISINIV